ncbi:MAG TPA: fused MFS/spermidine synthase [Burkholderiales bacterium]|nr:fused MFS/spermidine synthase [Burkholderiales bacterium]
MLREPFRLPLAFFASGAAALLFQVLWFRALGRVVGNTVWAGALVLTAFMLGMAIGGLLAARWAQRIRNPARAFALAEITVAVTGSLLVWGLPVLEPVVGHWLSPLADHSTAIAGVRLALALAAMLVPTIAMGTTLAFGVRIVAHKETTRALGVLYAANTFGAGLAPLVAEYYLIGALGLRGTALVAASLNLLAAALALTQAPNAAAVAAPARGTGPYPVRLLCAAAAAGSLALALEVIWFRLLILYAPGSDATFALMLTVVLFGISIGGALAPLIARPRLVWVTAGCSLAVVAGYMLAGWIFSSGKPDLIHYAVPLMLPAAILSGSLFALLGAELRADSQNPQPAIGVLTTANTLGAALGAALAGLVLLPRLGIEWSLFVLAGGYALLPLLVAKPARLTLPLLAAAAGLLLFPFGRIGMHLAEAAFPYQLIDSSRVVQVTQGPTTTLQLLKRERFGEAAAWRLLTDSYSMSAIDRESARYMQMFAWLPLALHPEPRRALLVSYGAGNTARALLSDPQLRSLTVVDVSPEIIAVSPLLHGKRDPLKDPRVQLVLEDGRHYLRVHREQFDIITAEPPPPLIAGVVNLYTREYFMALAERLAPGGLATYWLPAPQFKPQGARAVTRAFCDAFPDCTLWAGAQNDWILMGGREFSNRPSAQHFARLWRDPTAAPWIAASGFEHPDQLGATFLADAKQLHRWYGETPTLTDDHPKRIAPETRSIGAREAEYAAWLEPDGAQRRFQESQWVARHWPAQLTRASLPFFAIQPALNGEIAPDPVENVRHVDAILRYTDLRIPVLWLLGSDVTEQEIVNRRLAAEGYRPDYAYPLGARALAERDYAKAGELFAEAAERRPGQAGALAAYSMCRAGLRNRAAAVKGADELAPGLRCWRN